MASPLPPLIQPLDGPQMQTGLVGNLAAAGRIEGGEKIVIGGRDAARQMDQRLPRPEIGAVEVRIARVLADETTEEGEGEAVVAAMEQAVADGDDRIG